MTITNEIIKIVFTIFITAALASIAGVLFRDSPPNTIALISSIALTLLVLSGYLYVLFSKKTIIPWNFEFNVLFLSIALILFVVASVLIINKRQNDSFSSEITVLKEKIKALEMENDSLKTLISKIPANSQKTIDSLQAKINKCCKITPPSTLTSGSVYSYDKITGQIKPMAGVLLRIDGLDITTTDNRGFFEFRLSKLKNASCGKRIRVYFYKDDNNLSWKEIKLCNSDIDIQFQL